jgi:beta-glucosidase
LQVDRAAKTVTFAIENAGGLAGTEIAQIYVELPKAGKEHFRRLAAWQRVALNSGERKTVTVALEPLAMATFDEQKDAWTWPSGVYTVLVGGSSRDLPLQAGIALY